MPDNLSLPNSQIKSVQNISRENVGSQSLGEGIGNFENIPPAPCVQLNPENEVYIISQDLKQECDWF
jgi:hypothetical protein